MKLRLDPIEDDKPVKITLEIPAALHRDLACYADLLTAQSGQSAMPPEKLIIPMIRKFIAGDRAFSRAKATQR